MGNPINGMFSFLPTPGNARIIACFEGRLYSYNGATASVIGGATHSSKARVQFTQAENNVYSTSGIDLVIRTDGLTAVEPNILDAGGNVMTDVSDVLWFRDRMWYAQGDYLHFSELTPNGATPSPEYITEPPLEVRRGGGDQIVRILPYRSGFLLIFKSDRRGGGSVHVLDVADNHPENFNLQPLFENLAIIAPGVITRAGNDQDSDVFFLTREGVRTLRFTALDRFTQPSLPLSINMTTEMSRINYDALDMAHAVVFDDEFLMWVPTGIETLPDRVFAYTFKVPKQSPQNGWTTIDLMPASSSAIMGFSGKPSLYIGTNEDGIIQKAFATQSDDEYREISRRETFNTPANDKTPFKLYVFIDVASAGEIAVFLILEDGTEYEIGSQTIGSSGVQVPVQLPVQLGSGAIKTGIQPLHFDVDADDVKRFKDVRIKITSEDYPRILGWKLLCHLEALRYVELATSQAGSVTAGLFDEETVTAEALEIE